MNSCILLEMSFQPDTTMTQAKRGFRLGGKVTLLRGNRYSHPAWSWWAYWQLARWVPLEITKFLLPVQELCSLRTGIPFSLHPQDPDSLWQWETLSDQGINSGTNAWVQTTLNKCLNLIEFRLKICMAMVIRIKVYYFKKHWKQYWHIVSTM